jgi:hypothetical protein
MFGGKKINFFKKVEGNNMLCHHNSSRLREVIFQASMRIIVKFDKLQKNFETEKKHHYIKFFRKIFSGSPFKYTVFVIYMVKTCICY